MSTVTLLINFRYRVVIFIFFLLCFFASPIVTAQNTYLDTFSTEVYNANDGNSSFATSWDETGDDDDPSNGRIQIESNRLDFQNIDGRGIERELDLSGASYVELSFDFERTDGNEILQLQLWNSNTSDWEDILTFGNSPSSGTVTYVLQARHISASSGIRFETGSGNWGGSETIVVDDVLFRSFLPNVTVTDVTVDEGVGAVFNIASGTTVSGGFTIDFSTSDVTATAGLDYTANSGQVSFSGTAGEVQTVTVITNTDALIETNETFTFDISSTSPTVVIADSQAIATILDTNEINIANFTSINSCIGVFTDSGGSTGNYDNNETYTITICPDVGGAQVSANFTTFDVEQNFDFLFAYEGVGTTTLIDTYTNGVNVPGTITSTDASGCLTFVFTSDGSVNGLGWVADVSCSVTTPGLSIGDAVVGEGSGTISFPVTYTGPNTGAFTVDFSSAGGTAAENIDYDAASGTLSFSGTTNETLTIVTNITDDTDFEFAENFTVTLSNVSGGGPSLVKAVGTGTINDDDLLEDQPLELVEKFNGYTDYASTGNTLRADPNGVDECTIVSSSSNTLTSNITTGATIEAAYLYWSHSGATPDPNVTFEGIPVTASVSYRANRGTTQTFYNFRADVTSIVAATTNPNTESFDFSDLTIDNGDPYCSGTVVLGGWTLFIFYSDSSLPASSINLYQGFAGEQNSSESYPLDGFFANNITGAKATFVTWEGDPNISSAAESLSITNQGGTEITLSGDGGQTGNNAYNSTIYDNTGGSTTNITTTYGLDLDTYDISGNIGIGDNTITANVSAGNDYIIPNVVVIKVPSNLVTGTVFEDVNYGGGTGRNLTAASGQPVVGATVELYDSSNLLVDSTTTNTDGEYVLGGMDNGTYKVRVVNSSVRSTRTDGSTCLTCIPVQTYRSEFNPGNTTLLDIDEEIGGVNPGSEDPAAGVITGAQSVTEVTITNEGLVGVDFGFNFNTIVNTNDSGQGSLSQFIINANTLGNTGLDVVSNSIFDPAAGDDVSVFMIPPASDPFGRTADTGFTSGVFIIDQSTQLPDIIDADTHIDARTQTAYSTNLNAGTITAGDTVGTSGTILPDYEQPEVAVVGSGSSGTVLRVLSDNSVIRNMAIASSNNNIAIEVGGTITDANAVTITENLIGFDGNGNAIGASEGIRVNSNTSVNIDANYISSVDRGIRVNDATSVDITRNFLDGVNPDVNCFADGITLFGGSNINIENNLVFNSGATGIDQGNSFAGGALINQNTVANSGQSTGCTPTSEIFGVSLSGGGNTVSGNVIKNNAGAGVQVSGTSTGNLITQNSIFGNGTLTPSLGIDLSASGANDEADGVTLNDNGDADTGTNDLLNFPIFERVVVDGSTLEIKGWARPGSTIEIFVTDIGEGSAADGDNELGLTQDYGEGQTYLATVVEGSGADTATGVSSYNDPDGNADNTNEFEFSITIPSGVSAGDLITATATISNSTSEFSPELSVLPVDFGDAPDTYLTLLASDGPRHGVTDELYLGSLPPDSEVDASPNVSATGDGAEDDGVTIGGSTIQDRKFTLGDTVDFDVLTSSSNGSTGIINIWADLNIDGDFLDVGEQLVTNFSASLGNNTFNYTLPLTTTTGITYIRVRYSNENLTGPSGFTFEGEVEDYRVEVQSSFVEFASDNYAAVESTTDSPVLQLSGALPAPLTIDLIVSGGSATVGSDFTNSTAITIPSGVTTYTIPTSIFAIIDDTLLEASETINFTLANPASGLVIGDANSDTTTQSTTIYTITDNDAASIAINNVTVAEDIASGLATFTVTLTGDVQGSFTVDFDTVNNTAVAPGDYTTNSGTLNFAGTDGETETITISIIDDALLEPSENFNVDLSAISNALVGISVAQGTGTIADNDAASITIDDVTVNEAVGNATLTVTLSGAVQGGFDVDYDTANASATQPNDYTLTSGTLTFAGTDTETQQIVVPIINDNITESVENLVVDLSGITNTNVTINDAQGSITINDDDSSSIAINDVTVNEVSGTATFSVTLTGAVDNAFSVNYGSVNNTAIAPGDYTTNSGTLNFAGTNGETEIITITINNDNLVEPDETYFIDLAGVTGGLVTISDTRGIGTIEDNDAATVVINDITVAEDAGTATLTVSLTGDVQGGFSIDYLTANNTAIQPGDYTTASGTLTFAGTTGETESIIVSIVDNVVLEPTENLFVNLSGISNTLVTVSDSQGIITITDNDTANVSIDDVTVNEGAGTATFTVTLS
ncbi:Calx-beta domain-containing protein, partial [Spongiivirga citrea]